MHFSRSIVTFFRRRYILSGFPNDPYGLIGFGCWNETVYKPMQKRRELNDLESKKGSMTENEHQQKVAEIEEKYK